MRTKKYHITSEDDDTDLTIAITPNRVCKNPLEFAVLISIICMVQSNEELKEQYPNGTSILIRILLAEYLALILEDKMTPYLDAYPEDILNITKELIGTLQAKYLASEDGGKNLFNVVENSDGSLNITPKIKNNVFGKGANNE